VSGTGSLDLDSLRERVNQQLLALTTASVTDHPNQARYEALAEACHYVVANGGKRVRPALVYLAAAACSSQATPTAAAAASGLDHAACAIELLHTYSLVHDDLPAMDDDDLRRGRPSCHVAFDEATAILVGDALQARAFELLAIAPGLTPAQKLDMVATLAAAAGSLGMVGGQFVDITATDATLGLDQLRAMHEAKTGAIICAALTMGAAGGGADPAQRAALEQFGHHIGLAFQVVDDVLDVSGTAASLGKTGGKDSAANKPTYVSLMGLEGARQEAERLLEAALEALAPLGADAEPLRSLARFIVERDR
jgi:geranylgeranyl pyrophosphate synthase